MKTTYSRYLFANNNYSLINNKSERKKEWEWE